MPTYVPMDDNNYLQTPFTWSGFIGENHKSNSSSKDEQQSSVPAYCNMQLSGTVANGK